MMDKFDDFVILKDSAKKVLDAEILCPTGADEQIVVSIQLRRRSCPKLRPWKPGFYARPQVRSMYGADLQDLTVIRVFAALYGFEIVRSELHKRMVKLSGTVGQFRKAFKVVLMDQRIGGVVYRTRTGPIFLPMLAGIVTGVFGLDSRPQASHHLRYKRGSKPGIANSKPDAFDGNSLASIYNFPPGDGAGQTIGIIELGGGFNQSDISNYFNTLGLPVPVVKAVSVDGGTNSPGVDTNADTEVALDIEVE
jgi:kumamolisin